MEIANNSAFILRHPDHVKETLEQMNGTGCNFHIYLIGKYQAKPHPRVTIIPLKNTRQIAGIVASDMTRRRMCHIICTPDDLATKDKIQELQTIDASFAMQGGSITAMENVWSNLPKILNNYTVDSIGNAFHKKPVIIVSSGPSLNKNIDKLKDLQDRCVIVACSSSLHILKKAGITPHFCIALDPFAMSRDLLLENLDEKTILVSALMLNHKLVEETPGKKLFFLGEYDTRILKDTIKVTGMNRVFATNSTITVSAFAFAFHLGADPIIMVGQDMCYGDDDAEHGGDLDKKFEELYTVKEGEQPKGSAKNLYPITFKAVDGREVKSCLAYKEVFDYFNAMVPNIKDRKVVNATEGGAGVEGAEVLTLTEAAEKYMNSPLDFPVMKEHRFHQLKYKKYLAETVSDFRAMLCKTQGFIKKIQPMVEKAATDEKIQEELVNKIERWMDTVRILPSYILLETFMLWVWNWATTSPNWGDRLVMLANLEAVLIKCIELVEKAAKI